MTDLDVIVSDASDEEDDRPTSHPVVASLEVDLLGLPPYLLLEVEGKVFEIQVTELLRAIAVEMK